MAIDAEYITYLEDVFGVVPNTNLKKMFGGVGIFRHGLMYGLALSTGNIALKTDAQTIPDFQARNCEEWLYDRKDGKKAGMGYWYIPESLLDDSDELLEWSMKAFEVAVRADAKKPPSKRKLVS